VIELGSSADLEAEYTAKMMVMRRVPALTTKLGASVDTESASDAPRQLMLLNYCEGTATPAPPAAAATATAAAAAATATATATPAPAQATAVPAPSRRRLLHSDDTAQGHKDMGGPYSRRHLQSFPPPELADMDFDQSHGRKLQAGPPDDDEGGDDGGGGGGPSKPTFASPEEVFLTLKDTAIVDKLTTTNYHDFGRVV